MSMTNSDINARCQKWWGHHDWWLDDDEDDDKDVDDCRDDINNELTLRWKEEIFTLPSLHFWVFFKSHPVCYWCDMHGALCFWKYIFAAAVHVFVRVRMWHFLLVVHANTSGRRHDRFRFLISGTERQVVSYSITMAIITMAVIATSYSTTMPLR